jgi:hypothetical protein
MTMTAIKQHKVPAYARGAATTVASVLGLAALSAVLGLAALPTQTPAASAETSAPKLSPELERVRNQLARYRDPVAAVHDGYFSTLGCVHYKDGGMGVHFLNPALIGPNPDPGKPQILVYEPVGDALELVAAEWLIPLAAGIKERPTLFGQPFNGPMEGHEPLMPQALHHYDLHVWLFKANPKGVFAVTNPDVSCANYGYALLEEPTDVVAHHKAQ